MAKALGSILNTSMVAEPGDVDAVSNTVSNEASVRASAINAVSNAISNEISVRTSAVNAVSNAVSALEVRVSALSAGVVVSVTSAEVSAQVESARNDLSNAISNEISARASAVNAVSNAVSALEVRVSALSATPAGVSVTSNELSNVLSVANQAHPIDVLSLVASTTVDISIGTNGHDVIARVSGWKATQIYNVIGTPALNQKLTVIVKNTDFFSPTVVLFNTLTAGFLPRLVVSASRTGTIDLFSDGANFWEAFRNIGFDLVDQLSVVSASIAATSAAVDVVSARVVSVSAEVVSLIQIASAAATSADGHAAAASAAATSADAHAAAASAAATSVDGHVNTVSARVVSVSAEVVSLIQIASAAATSADGHAATASAAATSADAHAAAASAAATSVDGHVNTVSARVVSVSAEVVSLIQIASAAATSADGHAATASAAATSADGHANTVSVRAVSISAELASLVQIASAAATSADGHANTVSARVVSVSAEVASLVQIASAAATSADGHANTVSVRLVSVSAEVVSLIASAVARRAVNTNNQASITVSGGAGTTVSGVSIALTAGQTYRFHFQIPFTATQASGVFVAVVGPATNQFAAVYKIPGAAAQTGVAPAVNAITPFWANVGAIGTKVSTTSITLTGTTLMAEAWGTINPSAGGSLKFTIGPNTSGAANSGIIPLQGANVMVWRIA